MILINEFEVAAELAHNRTLCESGDICNNEDDMYNDPTSKELHYKDAVQNRFNEWYDYYLNQLLKFGKET